MDVLADDGELAPGRKQRHLPYPVIAASSVSASRGGQRLELAAVDEEVEEVGRQLELDVLDRAHEPLEALARRAREEQLARAQQRCVPDLDDAVRTDGGEEPDLDRVLDVDVGGEAAARYRRSTSPGSMPRVAQDDPLADRVRRLGLGERRRVGAGERDPRCRLDDDLARPVAKTPIGDIRPARRSSASRSIKPEPQIPRGLDVADRDARRTPRRRGVAPTRSRRRRPASRT